MTYTSPVKLRKGLLELAAVSLDTLPPQATRIHRSAPLLLNLGQEVRPISGAGANFLFLTSRCMIPTTLLISTQPPTKAATEPAKRTAERSESSGRKQSTK